MAKAAGKVAVEETDKAVKVIVTDAKGEDESYSFPAAHAAERRSTAIASRPARS